MVQVASTEAKVRCRLIETADLDAIVDLLVEGFPMRSAQYWRRGLQRQQARELPDTSPRYGYLLEAGNKPVGLVLLIFTPTADGAPRYNLSSWYVKPAFRMNATFLILAATKDRTVTYFNISPAPNTWPTVEAQGFSRYCQSQFYALPALNRPAAGTKVRLLRADSPDSAGLSDNERALLAAHATYGCLNLVCVAPDGVHPFVFRALRVRTGRIPVPCLQLVYCRDSEDFVRFAGSLGRFLLLRRLIPWVRLDANEPIKGLKGFLDAAKGRKYFKGPHKPKLGNLAFTEFVLFGP